jgi:hypothetical protein
MLNQLNGLNGRRKTRLFNLFNSFTFCRNVPLLGLAVVSLCLGQSVTRAATNVSDRSEDALRSALALGGTVIFTNDCSITLSDTITITNDVVINGFGHTVTISGGGGVRIFTVPPGFTLVLANLTLTGGSSTAGGALYVTAGASAWITNCVFIGNTAAGSTGSDGSAGGTNNANYGKNGADGTAGGWGLGGAIYNQGVLALLNSQVVSNTASGGAGGNGGSGGSGLYSGGNGGNGAAGGAAGGGGLCNASSATLLNCTFSANTSTGGSAGSGGAGGSGPFGGISGNGAAGAGSYGAAVYSTYSLIVANCTFANNTATAGNSSAAGTSSANNGINGSKGGDSLGGARVRLGAAVALEAIAGNEVMVSKVIRTLDLQTDGAKVSAELRALATSLRATDAVYDADGNLFAMDIVDFRPDRWFLPAAEAAEQSWCP